MQARVSAAYLAALSQTASVRVLYPPHWPSATKNCNNLPITDRPVERHDTLGIRCGHIDLPLATRARDGRARRTRTALRRVGRRVRGTHRFADDRTW
jgi:hypothetical protein